MSSAQRDGHCGWICEMHVSAFLEVSMGALFNQDAGNPKISNPWFLPCGSAASFRPPSEEHGGDLGTTSRCDESLLQGAGFQSLGDVLKDVFEIQPQGFHGMMMG